MIIENASVSYGSKIILEPSTLKVEQHGVTALLGRNGTGKTSLFNALYGLTHIQDLAVSFDGIIVKKPYTKPGLINYIPQKKCHPSWLVIEDLISSYGLDPDAFLKKHPVFLEDRSSEIRELSYGTTRLLVTLVALHADVQYTVLDEPFSNVAPVHAQLLVDTIKEVSTRKGILISDHQFRTVLSVTDKLYLIVDKRVKLLNGSADLITYGYLSEGTDLIDF
ncbi:MAG: ATP-binding cassette domain-containing protein [Lewinella sp.]